jgi:regulator of sigma E protease
MLLFDIVIFIVVVSVLVFFHELGHFLAAKACGIYCDRFSLGMPPRVWGFTWGETDYCIGALPIGGYVKMAGQEDAPDASEERQQSYSHVPIERWFNHRPVWQRVIVIGAGPTMNLILGAFLYAIVAAVGAEVPECKVDSRIGDVAPDSPAAHAPLYRIREEGLLPEPSLAEPDSIGWQAADRILSINGNVVSSIVDMRIDAILSKGRVSAVILERVEADGSLARYFSPVEPKVFGEDPYARFGVTAFETALVRAVMDGLPAKANGIEPGDVIVRAQGRWVDAATLTKLVQGMTHGETVSLEVRRGDRVFPVTLPTQRIGRFRGILLWPPETEKAGGGGERPVVRGITPEAAAKTGLKEGDIVLEANGQPATVSLLQEMERLRVGETVDLTVKRPVVAWGLLRKEEFRSATLEAAPVGVVGIVWGTAMVFHRVPPIQVLPEAFRQSCQTVERIVRTLRMLIVGGVSPRELGGPLLIYQVTTDAARLGYSWLLEHTAFISISLFVFNLLPFPVLDGGWLILLAVEAARRKPLDAKVQDRIQRVGLVFIIGLMLFVTYNDLTRMVAGLIP